MLKIKSLALVASLSLVAGVSSVSAIPITGGTQIGIDFGPTATDTAGNNWNEFNANGADNTIHDLNGAFLDNLIVTVAGAGGFNNDGTNNWVGLQSNATNISPNPKAPAPFVDSVTTDIAFSLSDLITVSISGLDNSLRYNIFAVSTAPFTPIDTFTVTGNAIFGPSAISRPTTVTNGLFHAFLNVGTNGSGNILISATDGNGVNPIINGILIQAISIPEPATMSLLALAGAAMLRRRRTA